MFKLKKFLPKTSVFLLMLNFVFVLSASAQKEKSFLLKFGAGMSYQNVRDEGMSPLLYKGDNFSFSAGADFAIGKSIHKADFRFDYGDITSERSGNIATNYWVEGSYTYLRFAKTFMNDKINLYAGGNFSSLWVLRDNQGYVNNSFNTDYISSIGPSAMLKYRFLILGKSFSAEYGLNVPLMAFVVRPSYASTTLPGFLEKENPDKIKSFFASGNVVSFGNFFKIDNEVAILFHLRNQNAMRFSYSWDYYSIAPEFNPVKNASHQLMFQLLYSF